MIYYMVAISILLITLVLILSYILKSKKKICNPVCTSGGKCDDGVCKCDSGYSGSTCSDKDCDPVCVNGKCDDGVCKCDSGYSGSTCSDKDCDPVCVNGKCKEGVCECDKNHYGSSCSDETCDNCGGCDKEKTCSVDYQRPFLSGTTSSVKTAADCRDAATKLKVDNWCFNTSSTDNNCIVGTTDPDIGCVSNRVGYISDNDAIKDDTVKCCALGKIDMSGKICTAQADCGTGHTCDKQPFSTLKRCSDGYCDVSSDCVSVLGGGECISNKCVQPDIIGYSCGMNKAFTPDDSQFDILKSICVGKKLGDSCQTTFGDAGNYVGRCGKSCSDKDPLSELTCYQTNRCERTKVTTVKNYTGMCTDISDSGDICFK
jgi:hypothetical protein